MLSLDWNEEPDGRAWAGQYNVVPDEDGRWSVWRSGKKLGILSSKDSGKKACEVFDSMWEKLVSEGLRL